MTDITLRDYGTTQIIIPESNLAVDAFSEEYSDVHIGDPMIFDTCSCSGYAEYCETVMPILSRLDIDYSHYGQGEIHSDDAGIAW